ncbi:glutathione hydrolase 1 proenzyme-like [Haemaphysalis longicornis]
MTRTHASRRGTVLSPVALTHMRSLISLPVLLGVCVCFCVLLLLAIIIVAILAFLGIIVFSKTGDDPFEKWAAVCDAPQCADVAKETFDKSGGIGDAAVAVLLCMGVTAPHLTGLGGGLIALLYDRSTQKVEVLDSLGVSPAGVTENVTALKRGANASIVPGAVAGYKALHSKIGRLPWKDLFLPAIRLAKDGFEIGPHLAEAIASNQHLLSESPSLKERFTNKATGSILREGDKLVQPALAALLEQLAANGPDYLYKQKLADEIEKDVAAQGGILKKTDLADYQPSSWKDLPVAVKMANGMYLHSAPIPGSGIVVAAAVQNISVKIENLKKKRRRRELPDMSSARMHHFVERLKFSLARRPELGDVKDVREKQQDLLTGILGFITQAMNPKKPLPTRSSYGIKYAPEEDFGGAHLTIVAPNGDAVSVTSGLNGIFGSGFSTTSGLLLNSYMDAFAKPGKQFGLDPSPANQLGPRKRPMTSMVPTMLTVSQTPSKLVGAFGASGGLPGISAMAQLITCLRYYSLPRCVKDDVRMQPTFRDDVENRVFAEPKSSEFDAVTKLRKWGNTVTEKKLPSSATGILITTGSTWMAPSDTVHVDGSHAGG